MMQAWAVAETHMMQEFVAEEELRKKGFEAFIPKCLTSRIIRFRRQFQERPYISGYVFASIDTDDYKWAAINSARGVKGMLYAAPHKPALVRNEAMAALLEVCNGKYQNDFDVFDRALFRVLPKGTEVDVPSLGDKATGKVIWTQNDRVKVMMSFLGTERAVTLSRSLLRVKGAEGASA